MGGGILEAHDERVHRIGIERQIVRRRQRRISAGGGVGKQAA